MTPELISIENDLYIVRLAVFLETNPQSNAFRQIMLTPEQFKKLSDLLASYYHSKEDPGFSVPVKEDKVKISFEMSSCYPQEDIDRAVAAGKM